MEKRLAQDQSQEEERTRVRSQVCLAATLSGKLTGVPILQSLAPPQTSGGQAKEGPLAGVPAAGPTPLFLRGLSSEYSPQHGSEQQDAKFLVLSNLDSELLPPTPQSV